MNGYLNVPSSPLTMVKQVRTKNQIVHGSSWNQYVFCVS